MTRDQFTRQLPSLCSLWQQSLASLDRAVSAQDDFQSFYIWLMATHPENLHFTPKVSVKFDVEYLFDRHFGNG
jgi:hypothetical protein